jgi:hypothetical protein
VLILKPIDYPPVKYIPTSQSDDGVFNSIIRQPCLSFIKCFTTMMKPC